MLRDEIKSRLGQRRKGDNANNLALWLNYYRGEYDYLNQDLTKTDGLESLGLAAAISSELSRLATLEMKSSISSGENVQDKNATKIEIIDRQYQKIARNSRRTIEYGLALGGIIIKPFRTANQSDDIAFSFLTPMNYIILGVHNYTDIVDIVFIDYLIKQETKLFKNERATYYTKLERHVKTATGYEVTNEVYKSKSINTLGEKVDIKTVDEWASLDEFEDIKTDTQLFGYFRNPQPNNLDLEEFEGASCFARAISLIQDADTQYQRILWEYEGSELAIHADTTLMKKTNSLPKGKERLYINTGLSSSSGNGNEKLDVFSPDIRDVSLFNGLNEIIRKIEITVGLAYGTLSEVHEVEKTAEEVKQSKQRSYSTVLDIQKEIQKCYTDAAKALAFLHGVNIQSEDISFDFDDSLVVSSSEEQKTMLQEVAAKVISREYYLKERYGMTDEEIAQVIPQIETDQYIDDLE